MIFERIEINNLRNLGEVEFQPEPGLNLVIGPNGSGKTALLEAIHLLVRGRSFRTNLTDSLIQHSQASLLVRSSLCTDHGVAKLAARKAHQESIQMRYNNQAVKQVSQIARNVPLQVIQANINEMVFGAPRLRRAWLDSGVFHQFPEFLESNRNWRRSLEQRNAALRQNDKASARMWNSSVGTYGMQVTKFREQHVEALQEEFNNCLGAMEAALHVELSLSKGYAGQSLKADLESGLERDLRVGATQIGPQRADVRLRLVEDTSTKTHRPADQVLSRGQGKIVGYAMKLATASFLHKLSIKTLLLIDDFDAEVDAIHQYSLIQLLLSMNTQVIVTTTTHPANLPFLEGLNSDKMTLFQIRQNRIDLVK